MVFAWAVRTSDTVLEGQILTSANVPVGAAFNIAQSEELTQVQLQPGQKIQLTATTLKNGSTLLDGWKVGANAVSSFSTTLNGTIESFESVYTFTAPSSVTQEAKFQVNYTINQTAGKSRNVWEGGAGVELVIPAPANTEPASINELVSISFVRAEFVLRDNGKYDILAHVTAHYADGATASKSVKCGNVDPGQTVTRDAKYSETYFEGDKAEYTIETTVKITVTAPSL